MSGTNDSTPPMRKTETRKTETIVTHTGRDPFANHGFVNTPVYRGSTVLFNTLDAYDSRTQKYDYCRRCSPTPAVRSARSTGSS